MTEITSEPNNVGSHRLYAALHDTGDIGVGEITKAGKFSAHLYAPDDVRDFGEDMVALAKLAGAEPTEEQKQLAEALELLGTMNTWACSYDWYECEGDVEDELSPLRDRINALLAAAGPQEAPVE